MNTNYNDYNGRIAETIIETFIKKTGFLVQKFGVENQFGTGIDLLNSTKNVIEKGKGNIVKYMTLPDFTAIKVNSNGDMEQVYFIDSKYRSYDNKQHLIRELKENGDIFRQAKKYKDIWDSKVFLFLIVKFKDTNEIMAYYDTCSYIIEKENIRPLWVQLRKNWIKEEDYKEFNELINRVF